MFKLKVMKRDLNEDLVALRKAGNMPAVFYGKKEASTPISLAQVDFMKAWKDAGESTVVSLEHDGGSVDTLIHDVAFDSVTGAPLHADFYVFDKTHKLEVDVPLEFIGVAPAVKDLGGLLVKVMYEIKIEALPTDLPHQIDVDVSSLSEIGSQVLASDLKLPSGVTLVDKGEEVVALVAAPKEDEPEEVAPVDLSAIEVEKKGKEANPEEGADTSAAEVSPEK